MKTTYNLIITLISLLLISASFATTTDNWFCVQRLVPNISIGAIWTHGQQQIFADVNNNNVDVPQKIEDATQALLAAKNHNDSQTIIKNFTQLNHSNKDLTWLFAYTVKNINQQRQKKIAYILRYGQNHKNRVKALQHTREQIRSALQTNQADKLAKLQQQYKWQTAIFNARKKHNPFLCQQVVAYDAEAYFLATEIGKYIKK